MLTIQQCKNILNDDTLTEEQVIQMRDWLYQIAELAIEVTDESKFGKIEK